MTVKVLFIPHPMPSHIIPLIALAKLLNKTSFDIVFLLPQEFHEYVRKFGFKVLDIDRKIENRTTPEMIAFSKFKPHIVIDDLSYTTAFSTRFAKLPRISIVRKGILPYETHDAGSTHSSDVIRFLETIKKIDLPSYGIWKPENMSDLFVGDVNIIPSIAAIEELPEEIKNKSAYIYSGPLLLSDPEIMENLASLTLVSKGKKYEDTREIVRSFIERNKGKKIVYFTHGLTNPADITKRGGACTSFLLQQGFAVITNLQNFTTLTPEEEGRFFSASLLPMQMICTHAHLMIHHCGSGTYNYQVSYEVPAIILGSKFYDRDDTAVQLDKLNAAHFIPADLDDEIWQTEFETSVLKLLDQTTQEFEEQKAALAKLNVEMATVSRNFDFQEIILKTVNK